MLKNINTIEDVYAFCRKNPIICKNNKQIICKKILLLSGYKKFLTKNYYIICKELLKIASKYTFFLDVQDSNYIKMSMSLLYACKKYGSSGLKQFIDINIPNNIYGYGYNCEYGYCYGYEYIDGYEYAEMTNEKCITKTDTLYSEMYSEMYSDIILNDDILNNDILNNDILNNDILNDDILNNDILNNDILNY